MLGSFNLISPFPESHLPCIFDWVQPFKAQVFGDDPPESRGDFVDEWKERAIGARTWAVERDGAYGGYIEFKPFASTVPFAGYCEALFKKSFWGRENTLPVLDSVMEKLFAEDVELVLFDPFQHNKAIRSLVKELGAREIGPVPYGETRHGAPVDRILFGLVAEEWQQRSRMRENVILRAAS